ncbi:MAG: hypothetical protein R2755_19430 [Acidimicrobiales bacterium]
MLAEQPARRQVALQCVALDRPGADVLHRVGHVVGEQQQLQILRCDRAGRHHLVDLAAQTVPVGRAHHHHREVADLAGLDEGERLEQLVERAEPTGQHHERG